jgi:hypothetical protein
MTDLATEADVGAEPSHVERWQRESAFREREVTVKEREQSLKAQELELRRKEQTNSGWRNPLVVAIIAASVAALGNAAVALTNGILQRQLEDEKAEQARVLEMIKTGSADKAAENLAFLINIGLVTKKVHVEKLAAFLKQRQNGEGPVLPAADGTREISGATYHPAAIALGERMVRIQVRELAPNPKKTTSNRGNFKLDGGDIGYADESIFETVKSVGATPQKLIITGTGLVNEFMEVRVTELGYDQEELHEEVFKQPVASGRSRLEYTTHAIDVQEILKKRALASARSATTASSSNADKR